MSSPTIKDVAKLAGVSISTVSRVMNDSKPVSPEARRKVIDAINKLDFKPNELARSLVMKRSNLIGVIVKDIGISYMAQIVRGIEEIGRMYKYDILLSSTYGDIEQESKIMDFMLTKQVEGIVMISEDTNPEVIYKLKNQSAPFIHLDKFYDYEDTHTVSIDYVNASKEMTNYLIKQNHKRIIFLEESTGTKIGKAKQKGYIDVMEENGLEAIIINAAGINIKDGYDISEKILEKAVKEDVSAVFCSEDELAIGLLNYCYDHNVKVPENISIAGFGDVPLASTYRPSLTTVREPYYDIGAVSMRKLVKELKENQKIIDNTILPSELIERESVLKI